MANTDRKYYKHYGTPERARRPSCISLPAHCHPAAALAFQLMRERNIRYDEVEERSGVLRTTIKAWRYKNVPTLTSIEAVLGVLGWDLLPVPKPETLSDELRRDLAPLAEKHGEPLETLVAYLVETRALAEANRESSRERVAAAAEHFRRRSAEAARRRAAKSGADIHA